MPNNWNVKRSTRSVLRFYERRLDDAKAKEEKRKKDEQRDPREIADRIMGG